MKKFHLERPITVTIATIIFIVVLIPVLTLLTAIYIVTPESKGAAQEEFWRVIGERSIQISRLKMVFEPPLVPTENFIPDQVWKNISDLNCRSPIRSLAGDPRKRRLVSAGIISRSPWKVYFFYPGSPPDLEPFLGRGADRELMGQVRSLADADKGNFQATGDQLIGRDYRAEFDDIIAGRHFEWRSVVCANFSYTAIEEIE